MWTVVVTVDRPVSLATVDAVLRLHLAVRRAGGRLAVRGATAELAELMSLVGLDPMLLLDPQCGSGEPQGQSEAGEQLLVEEVVDVGDPPRG